MKMSNDELRNGILLGDVICSMGRAWKVKEVEPTCVECGEILSDEEVDHCGEYCFRCYKENTEVTEHPDYFAEEGKSIWER